MKPRICILYLVTSVLLFPGICAWAGSGGAYSYWSATMGPGAVPVMNVVGVAQTHKIQKGETLLDIARDYGLGFNEIALRHPEMDPWVPPAGETIEIPTMWVLPYTRHEAVVVNIPEMRLYRFYPEHQMVKTYPLGIGRQGFKTPITDTKVVTRIEKPVWTVPENTREKVGRAIVPPGPANPLGEYWVGLADGHIGIHGTNFPWGIGRQVSQGCLRMYPEHIEKFFHEVSVDTLVEIVYKPVKIGIRNRQIFLEVHPDIHDKISDMYRHTESLLKSRALLAGTDPDRVREAVAAKRGIPTYVGKVTKNNLQEKGGEQ
ncbi:MAG: L,D-transpeptidase family protein [Desulfobacterales bacterium]|nr:L,D-transpeptidase family protein [Desulfobacterales bacterium]